MSESNYLPAWPYTPEREQDIHTRWIESDPFGEDCAGMRVRADREQAVLEGLRAARSDIRSLLLEIERLRKGGTARQPDHPCECWRVDVHSYGLSPAARDALFDRIAEAAHALDEQVSGTGYPCAECEAS